MHSQSSNSVVPNKSEVADAKKVFEFYKLAVQEVDYLKQLKDEFYEGLFQYGARPRTGSLNNPDGLYTEVAHHVAILKSVIPEIVPEDNFGLVTPPKSLYEWVFVRFHLDLKMMSKQPKEAFMAYIAMLDEGAQEAAREGKELELEHGFKREAVLAESLHSLLPNRNVTRSHYFVTLLNQIVEECLRRMLWVVYLNWYPEESVIGKSKAA